MRTPHYSYPLLTFLLGACVPAVGHAQSLNYFDGIVVSVGAVVVLLVPVFIALALAVFIWGLLSFVLKADNEQERADGHQRMIWGVGILFVAVTVWGIIQLMYQITGVERNPNISAPDTGFIGAGAPTGGGGGGGGPGGGTPPPPGGLP